MLTSALLYLLYGFLSLLTLPFRLLPDVTTPVQLTSLLTTANGYLASGYSWLPHTLDTLLYTWGIYLTVEVAIFVFKGIMWVIKKIPGIA